MINDRMHDNVSLNNRIVSANVKQTKTQDQTDGSKPDKSSHKSTKSLNWSSNLFIYDDFIDLIYSDVKSDCSLDQKVTNSETKTESGKNDAYVSNPIPEVLKKSMEINKYLLKIKNDKKYFIEWIYRI